MDGKELSAAQLALDGFNIDGCNPFSSGTGVATTIMTEAHGLLKVISTAYGDAAGSVAGGVETDLALLNKAFVSSALQGIGSLIALAMFLQEQES